jgi:hypothetical protein
MHDQRHDLAVVELLVRFQRGDRHPVEREQREEQRRAERQPQRQQARLPATALDRHDLIFMIWAIMISPDAGKSPWRG